MRLSAIGLESVLDLQRSESSEMTQSYSSAGHGLDRTLRRAYTVTVGDLDQLLLGTTSRPALRLVGRHPPPPVVSNSKVKLRFGVSVPGHLVNG